MKKLSHLFRTAVLAGFGFLGVLTARDAFAQTGGEDKTYITIDAVLQDSSYIQSPLNFDIRYKGWQERQEKALQDPVKKGKFDAWLSQFDAFRDAPFVEQLQIANDIVNRDVTYLADVPGNDDWASPVETILSGQGDCEDFSIAKYCALEYMGVPTARLSLTLVAIGLPEYNVSHAVLVADVSESANSTNCLILDNREKDILRLSDTPYWPKCTASNSGVQTVARVTPGLTINHAGRNP